MKHVKYGFTKFSATSSFEQIGDLFRGLLRTTYSYPKTIFYSLRYNSGEKFLLDMPYLYPYRYDLNIDNIKAKEPLRLSTSLVVSLSNLQLYSLKPLSSSSDFLGFESRTQKQNFTNFNSAFLELYKSFEYNNTNKKFDPPVAVAARTLYAASKLSKINSEFKEEELKMDTLKFILHKFMEKIQFADGESICQVLHTLAHFNYFKVDVWNKILTELPKKSFEPEYTKVKSKFPLFFRYTEVAKKRAVPELDITNNDLFINGYKPIYEAYNAILKAESNTSSIDAKEVKSMFENRFPVVKSNSLSVADMI